MRALLHSAPLLLLLALGTALAQDCYYPNGDVSSTDAPCGGGTGMCCPLNWQCLSNGLCSLPGQALLGRYTCTDRSWKSTSCPQFCTHNGTASGDEDIRRCSDGSYCCNGDGSIHCCSKSDTEFLHLASGQPIATILSLSSPTSSALSASTASSSSSSATSSTTTTGASIQSAVPTNETASATPPSSSTGPEAAGSHSGRILGLAIGIPAGLLALAAALFLVHRRRRKTPPTPSVSDFSKDPAMLHSYGHFPPGGRAPELDSFPVAAVGGHRSELPYSPALSSTRDSHASPLLTKSEAGTPELLPGHQSSPPAELWADFVPYRPPRYTGKDPPVVTCTGGGTPSRPGALDGTAEEKAAQAGGLIASTEDGVK